MTQAPLDPNDPTLLLNVRVTTAQATRARAAAQRAGITVSAFLRGLLDGQAYYAPDAREREAYYAARVKELEAQYADLEKRITQMTNQRDHYRRQVHVLEEKLRERPAPKLKPVPEFASEADPAVLRAEIDRLARANKGLTTANATLKQKIKTIVVDRDRYAAPMSNSLRLTLIKALHEDNEKSASAPQVREDALKRFNVWCDGQKARR